MKKKLWYLLITSISAIALFGCTKEEVNKTAETTSAEQESTTMQEESDEQETSTEMETTTEEETTTKHEHDYKEEVVNATCGKKGSKIFTCTSCNDTYSEEIPALEHAYNVTGVSNATCTSKGAKVYTCSICTHSYTEELPIVGHNWKAATCTVAQTCSVCGVTNGNALGHNETVNGCCERCGLQISLPTYDYIISYPKEDIKAYKKVDGTMRNRVVVSNITCTYDDSKNPTLVTIAYNATKQYQGYSLPGDTIENIVYITLFDVNGNQIGQKTIVTNLEKDQSQACSAYFQVTPGMYTITITGE